MFTLAVTKMCISTSQLRLDGHVFLVSSQSRALASHAGARRLLFAHAH